MRWHRLTNGVFQVVPTGSDGVVRSTVFPGLWLDVPAFLTGDAARVLTVLTQGLNTTEHADFVARLAQRRG